MSRTTRADVKGRLAMARQSAAGQLPELIGEPVDLPGWHLWSVGRVAVIMPILSPAAPQRVRAAYRDRVIANATGRCPRCDSVHTDDETSFAHEHGCPLLQPMDRWLTR